MAEAPRLLTTNDPTGYAPYSVTAVLATVLASVYLLVMLLLGGAAFFGGQQFVEPLLLILPAGILVLAFAGRRQILNSEGTRAGLRLCTFAWWVAVLGGFGYAAYLVGRSIGVQQDAKAAVTAWMDTLQKGDPVDPRNPDFHKAFVLTLDTGRQQSVEVRTKDGKPPEKKDIEAAQRGFHDDTPGTMGLTRFRQIDLNRILHRNRDFSPTFAFTGLQSWQQDVSGMRCRASGTLTTPEGEFKLNFDMMRQIVDNRPIWRIVAPTQGFIGGARVTRYGQRLIELEASGREAVTTVLRVFQDVPQTRPAILQSVQQPGFEKLEFLKSIFSRTLTAGQLGSVVLEPPGYETQVKSQFFVPLDRADAAKDGDPREKFFAAWRQGNIAPAGGFLKESPDQSPLMTVTEKAVELRVPVEVQLPQMGSGAAARGYAVLVADDPAFIAGLNDLRKAAPTDAPADPVMPKPDFTIPWRVRNVESDMKLVSMPRGGPNQGQAGGPPMPGGR